MATPKSGGPQRAGDRAVQGLSLRGTIPAAGSSGRDSDSISDRPADQVDPKPAIDSLGRCVRTDVPARLDQLLPGEAALVYQHIKDRLADILGYGD